MPSNSSHGHAVTGSKAADGPAGDVDAKFAELEKAFHDHLYPPVPVPTPGPVPIPTPVPVPPVVPPPAPIPSASTIVGMAMGTYYGGAATVADAKACVTHVTVATPNGGGEAKFLPDYLAAGMGVLNLRVGPYDKVRGILSIDPAGWAAQAVAYYKAHPAIVSMEILNEPSGTWFWGPNAHGPGQHAHYVKIMRAVRTAFDALPKRPKLLASFDGGYAGATLWGEQVLAADRHAYDAVDAITMHPYGGNDANRRGASALGLRSGVLAAASLSGKPVWITEVGWPTATGQPATGDSLQWSEADQAINISNFVKWARATAVVGAVIIFAYQDYGSKEFYGVTRIGGSHKPSYDALRALRAA